MVRILARLLALLALVAVAAGIYVIVHTTVLKPHSTVSSSSTTAKTTRRPHHKHKAAPTFYVVKPGDSLSSIASKTGVSQARLTALNPSVSAPPYNLQTGQRLRLRR